MVDEAVSVSPPALTDLVLERLRRPVAAAAKARRLGLSMEALDAATERFVTAGAGALAANLPSSRWVCFGLEAARGGAAAWQSPRFFGALGKNARRWLREGAITGFFFMGKPPGLRLRFEASDPESFEKRLRRWLSRQGAADYARAQTYEPEEHQFGGPEGARIAHRLFTADSLAALAFKAGAGRADSRVTAEFLSLYCILPVLREIALDQLELWDLWRNLRWTGRLPANPPRSRAVDAVAAQLRPLLDSPWDEAVNRLPQRERRIVRRAEAETRGLGAQLREAADAGELNYPPRKIAPFWLIFQWNRWGLRGAMQRTLAIGVERALNPKEEPVPAESTAVGAL